MDNQQDDSLSSEQLKGLPRALEHLSDLEHLIPPDSGLVSLPKMISPRNRFVAAARDPKPNEDKYGNSEASTREFGMIMNHDTHYNDELDMDQQSQEYWDSLDW